MGGGGGFFFTLCSQLARTRSKKPKNSEKSKKSKKSTPSEATGGVFGVPLVELIANDGGKEVDGLVVPRLFRIGPFTVIYK